jgi:three-Cys-motif partner protein
MTAIKFDEIGYWSEIKLDIINDYASAYSRILSAQTNPLLYHLYIDAFAGAGLHISKETGELIRGSPLNALQIHPPFDEYHFIDLDEKKIESLEEFSGSRNDVSIYHGNCNQILLEKIFPKVKYENYRRALCVLDPYGLQLDWEIILAAGRSQTIEIFLNFPVMDMNRNVLWRNPEKVPAKQIERMSRFWGDASWQNIAYTPPAQMSFSEFNIEEKEKGTNEEIVEAFRKRLMQVAGFQYIPKPIAMRNRQNAVIYFLFFAAHKPVAADIVKDIFLKYSNMGE